MPGGGCDEGAARVCSRGATVLALAAAVAVVLAPAPSVASTTVWTCASGTWSAATLPGYPKTTLDDNGNSLLVKPPARCASGWTAHDGRCHLRSSQTGSGVTGFLHYADAKTSCVSVNANLGA